MLLESWLALAAGLALGTGWMMIKRQESSGEKPKELPPQLRSSLLDREEREVLSHLEHLWGEGYRVFSKVALNDLLIPPALLSPANDSTPPACVDFLVCRLPDLRPVLALKLQAPVPEQPGLLTQMLTEVGLPLLMIPHDLAFRPEELHALLATGLDLAPPTTATPRQANAVVFQPGKQLWPGLPQEFGAAASIHPASRRCPVCGAFMIRKPAPAGKIADRWLWVCSAAPSCNKVVTINSGHPGKNLA